MAKVSQTNKCTILIRLTFLCFIILPILLLFNVTNLNVFNIQQIQQSNQLQHNIDHFAIVVNKRLTLDSQLDVIKYKSTNTTICDIWETSSLLVGTHHKTGTILLAIGLSQQILQRYIRTICYHNNTIPLKYSLYGKNRMNRLKIDFGLSQDKVEKFHNDSLKTLIETRNNSYSYHFVTLNIVRDPVDTVLSEYNYDKKSTTPLSVTKIGEFNHSNAARFGINMFISFIEPILNMTRDEIINRYSLQVLW
eukprot:232072_1